MAWTSLKNRLNEKKVPLVIAGPILRRVDERSVTVWVALIQKATVRIFIWEADPDTGTVRGAPYMAQRDTTHIGNNLHMVAVTARMPVDHPLKSGQIYVYQLSFVHDGKEDLLEDSIGAPAGTRPLAYAPFKLPSFALPPAELNQLRVLHGSCRKAHASGPDALAMADDLIFQTVVHPELRPHQLLLTGDQIYADEVADLLLLMVSDAGEALLGWQELFPRKPDFATGPEFPPTHVSAHPPRTRRTYLVAAGFTSDDLESHLQFFGEYLAMYLFAWSDALWPQASSDMPTFADLVARIRAGMSEPSNNDPLLGPSLLDYWEDDANRHRKDIEEAFASVAEFKATLPKVRRALANIPTYMICDDHEVTDDWNMTYRTTQMHYKTEYGVRVIQNALLAYALCQHWGNAPEQFEDAYDSSRGMPAGRALLQIVNQMDDMTFVLPDDNATLQKILGVHDSATLASRHSDGRVFHELNTWTTSFDRLVSCDSLLYHYTIEGPKHQILVTDSRTWRAFPGGGMESADLIEKDLLSLQARMIPETNGRVLMVVLTTNAPATPGIRATERHTTVTRIVGGEYFDLDSWELGTPAFNRLIARLTDRLPLDSSNVNRVGPIILLSGDVHHSFATRLLYQAEQRFEDHGYGAPAHGANVVFAQLVASALKNHSDKTYALHREGYAYAPTGSGWLVDGPVATGEIYDGWNDAGRLLFVGNYDLAGYKAVLVASDDKPVLREQSAQTNWVKPSYRYRLDYILPAGVGTRSLTPPRILPGAVKVDDYNTATSHYRDYNRFHTSKLQVVGVNNLGEVTFDGAGASLKVNHTVRWVEPDHPGGPPVGYWATYVVPLDPGAPHLEMPPAPPVVVP